MEDITVADNAVHGGTDISGVKNAEVLYPDGAADSVACAADTQKNKADDGKCVLTGAIETEISEENNGLEAEFEALIEGKYRDVYRRRTESIIRKRLKSGKAHPDSISASAEAKCSSEEAQSQSAPSEELSKAPVSENIPVSSDAGISGEGKNNAYDYQAVRERNKNRPIENGLSGSCGIVTKINVSALDGDGVLSILRRVSSGEKISFK